MILSIDISVVLKSSNIIMLLLIFLFMFVNSCLLNHFSCVWLFETLWTVACQAPLSMEFSGVLLPFPSPGDLPDPGIQPSSLMSPALAGRFFTTSATWICLINWGAGCICICCCYVFFLDWSLHHYSVFFFVSCNSLYLKSIHLIQVLLFQLFKKFFHEWNIFFHPLTFSLYVSLNLRWAFSRQHMYRLYFSYPFSQCMSFSWHI